MALPVRHDAIVLGTVDLGEKDRIVRLLVASEGRVSALARGARGSRRRFGGVLDPGNRVTALLRSGQTDLWHLEEATLRGPVPPREDLARTALGLYGCETVSDFSEAHPEPRLYGQLETLLSLAATPSWRPGSAARNAFEAKVLTFAGFTPVLLACTRCGEALADRVRFDPAAGGAVHRDCGGGEDVPAALLHALERLRRTPLADLSAAGSLATWSGLSLPAGSGWLLARFAEYHLGRALRSRAWLLAVEDESRP